MQNFAECIAVKGIFCGRKLRKKLRGQIKVRKKSEVLWQKYHAKCAVRPFRT